MKKYLVLLLLMYTTFANAESVQSFCNQMASNANNMYVDLTSDEFKSGQVSYTTLANNYSRQSTQFMSNLALVILETIHKNRDNVSAQKVNSWIYSRCEADYYNNQAWWRSHRY